MLFMLRTVVLGVAVAFWLPGALANAAVNAYMVRVSTAQDIAFIDTIIKRVHEINADWANSTPGNGTP